MSAAAASVLPAGPDAALMAAIVAALQTQPQLSAVIGGRVADGPMPGMTSPFIYCVQSQVQPWGGLAPNAGPEATEHVLMATAVSRSGQIGDARALAALIRATLHDAPLTLAGFHLVNLRVVFTDVYPAADAVTYLGVVRLRAVVEPV